MYTSTMCFSVEKTILTLGDWTHDNTRTTLQWLYFRVRKEGDTPALKMETACTRLMLTEGGESKFSPAENVSHDVFISYAHKDPKQAQLLLDEFEKQYPDMEVFFDRQDLQVGMSCNALALTGYSICQITISQCIIRDSSDTNMQLSIYAPLWDLFRWLNDCGHFFLYLAAIRLNWFHREDLCFRKTFKFLI